MKELVKDRPLGCMGYLSSEVFVRDRLGRWRIEVVSDKELTEVRKVVEYN